MEKTERIYKKFDSNLSDADKALLSRIEAQFRQDRLDGFWGFADEMEEIDEADVFDKLYTTRGNKK